VAAEPAGLDRTRWTELWKRIGARGDGLDVFSRLETGYGEPARAYHTAAHVRHCLEEFDRDRSLAARPDEVEMALWFHDAVYVPGAGDNEVRSADWALKELTSAGTAPGPAQRIHALIVATRHSNIPADCDARLLCDIDLSILGQTPAVFDEFERQIRQEYAWVPEPYYRQTRSKVLAGFLSRKAIYQTEPFASRYEARARENLERALRNLSD
jgi:predicted metal-dependent HD superfamily phosphohydrolase